MSFKSTTIGLSKVKSTQSLTALAQFVGLALIQNLVGFNWLSGLFKFWKLRTNFLLARSSLLPSTVPKTIAQQEFPCSNLKWDTPFEWENEKFLVVWLFCV